MKSYSKFQKFHNESPVWVILVRILFLLGLSLWLGSLIMFGFGVAPTSFAIAKSWDLTGINPDLPQQIVNYKTIGGALTSNVLLRMNQIEVVALSLISIAFLLAWMPSHSRNQYLLVQTFVAAAMAIVFLIYTEKIGARMFEIQNTIPIDYSIVEKSMQIPEHLEFNKLHKIYSRLVSLNVFLGFILLVLFSIFPLSEYKKKHNSQYD